MALAGDEPVGYAIAVDDEPGVAEHWITGVRRDWRGRGLATALKTVQIEAARAAGPRELRTQNESTNTAMRRVNERLGFKPRLTWLHVAGPLLPWPE